VTSKGKTDVEAVWFRPVRILSIGSSSPTPRPFRLLKKRKRRVAARHGARLIWIRVYRTSPWRLGDPRQPRGNLSAYRLLLDSQKNGRTNRSRDNRPVRKRNRRCFGDRNAPAGHAAVTPSAIGERRPPLLFVATPRALTAPKKGPLNRGLFRVGLTVDACYHSVQRSPRQ
jgi:hypothetical protein